MRKVKYLRSIRHEIISVFLVLSSPLILLILFPFKAVSFKPAAVQPQERTSFALVQIAPEYERSLMAGIRSTWSVGRSLGMMSAPEIPMELPAEELNIKLNSQFPKSSLRDDFISYEFLPMPPTVAAKPYAALVAEAPEEKTETFSRQEMLLLPELN